MRPRLPSYEWTGQDTPFGLSGAPATFQRLMSAILGQGELNWTAALCYLDDVLVWGRSWTEHNSRLREVLSKLRSAGVLLNPDKCCFGVREVEFLGHVIAAGTMRISEARTQSLRRTPKPTTVTMLRKAMGAFFIRSALDPRHGDHCKTAVRNDEGSSQHAASME
eukprot:scpid45335/ scgid16129/ Retrovirus-related Pol polyprotein from transposon 297; Protease; Reverse transcriptase; Endonuclease